MLNSNKGIDWSTPGTVGGGMIGSTLGGMLGGGGDFARCRPAGDIRRSRPFVLNTDTARQIARHVVAFMRAFLDQLVSEFDDTGT